MSMWILKHEVRLNGLEARLNDYERRLGVVEGAIPPKKATAPVSPKREAARAFLKERLSEAPKMSAEILSWAREAGISERVLRRAKRDLRVESYRVLGVTANRRQWAWRFPRGVLAEEERRGAQSKVV